MQKDTYHMCMHLLVCNLIFNNLALCEFKETDETDLFTNAYIYIIYKYTYIYKYIYIYIYI